MGDTLNEIAEQGGSLNLPSRFAGAPLFDSGQQSSILGVGFVGPPAAIRADGELEVKSGGCGFVSAKPFGAVALVAWREVATKHMAQR